MPWHHFKVIHCLLVGPVDGPVVLICAELPTVASTQSLRYDVHVDFIHHHLQTFLLG